MSTTEPAGTAGTTESVGTRCVDMSTAATRPAVDTIGSRLRKMRQFRGLTLADLASKIGSSSPSISAIENGRQNIGLKMLIKICDELRVSLDWIVYGENAGYRYNPVVASTASPGVTVASGGSSVGSKDAKDPTANQSKLSGADGADGTDGTEGVDGVDIFDRLDDVLREPEPGEPHDPEPRGTGLDGTRIKKSEFLKFQAELYDKLTQAGWE